MRHCMWAGAQAQTQAENQAQPGPSGCQPNSQQANSQQANSQEHEAQFGNFFFFTTSRYMLNGKPRSTAQKSKTQDFYIITLKKL